MSRRTKAIASICGRRERSGKLEYQAVYTAEHGSARTEWLVLPSLRRHAGVKSSDTSNYVGRMVLEYDRQHPDADGFTGVVRAEGGAAAAAAAARGQGKKEAVEKPNLQRKATKTKKLSLKTKGKKKAAEDDAGPPSKRVAVLAGDTRNRKRVPGNRGPDRPAVATVDADAGSAPPPSSAPSPARLLQEHEHQPELKNDGTQQGSLRKGKVSWNR